MTRAVHGLGHSMSEAACTNEAFKEGLLIRH
jgi:hypothetical protein